MFLEWLEARDAIAVVVSRIDSPANDNAGEALSYQFHPFEHDVFEFGLELSASSHNDPTDNVTISVIALACHAISSLRSPEFPHHSGSLLIGTRPKRFDTQAAADIPQILKSRVRDMIESRIRELTEGRVVTGVAVMATVISAFSRSVKAAQYALLMFRQLWASSMATTKNL
jgi:hypothetical protein